MKNAINIIHDLKNLSLMLIEKMKHPFTSSELDVNICNKISEIMYYVEETVGADTNVYKSLLNIFQELDECFSNTPSNFDKQIKIYTDVTDLIYTLHIVIDDYDWYNLEIVHYN